MWMVLLEGLAFQLHFASHREFRKNHLSLDEMQSGIPEDLSQEAK